MATPLTQFYFIRKDTDEAYEMNATTNISITRDAIATERAVEGGKAITDNIYLKNAEVSFSGLITSINNKSNLTDVNQFLDEIDELRASDSPLVDVYADGRFIPDCIIVSLNINKSASEGLGAWLTEFRLQQITFTERARLVEIPEAAPAQKDAVDARASKSGNTVQEVEVSTTVGAGLLFPDFVNNIPTINTPVNSEGGS